MKYENTVQIQAATLETPAPAQLLKDYRSVLRAELVRKQEVNPRYSLRRFAIHLGISAATLCGVLRRSRKLSIGTAQKVAVRLELEGERKAAFLLSVAEDFRKKEEEPEIEMRQSVGA